MPNGARWCLAKFAKLVNITPITMGYIVDMTIVDYN